MADAIDRYADDRCEYLRRRIREVYEEASADVRKKLDAFTAGHRRRAEMFRQMVDAGQMTQEAYQDWMRGQVFIGQRWEAVLRDVTQTYVDADARAREIVGREDRSVFAEAANQTARRIDTRVSGGFSFAVYDEHAVDRLIVAEPQMLPEWKIDEPKDYIWNERRVRNAVTQGIIQGESISRIADRLTDGLAAQNAGKMQMFARTAVTGAQNAGRVERMREAEAQGITVLKKWLAVHDSRTRDAHAHLDGQTARPDEPFIDENGERLMFPGDPTASPAATYNCRCTLVYVYPQYEGGR